MILKSELLLSRTAGAMTLAILALTPFLAFAQPTGSTYSQNTHRETIATPPSQGVGIQFGLNSKYRRLTLSYDTPSLWQYRFGNDWGHISLNVELGLSYWDAKRGTPQSMWQLGAIPTLRWWPNESVYIEAGVGPSVLNRTRFAGSDLSTRFQFETHLGVGFVIDDAHRLSLRYSHISNANIKRPNPGLDLLQVNYSYLF